MYVYYFRTRNSRSNHILVSHCTETKPCAWVARSCDVVVAILDNGYIPKSQIVVPRREGAVYKRVFWLKEHDMERARQIVKDYIEARLIKINGVHYLEEES